MSVSVLLNNGVRMPSLGVGTYLASGNAVKSGVKAALRAGIRHIDTASLYRNEVQVGEAIREAGVDRSQVFITTKIAPFQQGTERATKSLNDSLAKLRTDYLDLVLIHWPGVSRIDSWSPENAKLRLETWRVLEAAYEQGRCKAIGVSNYQESHLTELVAQARIKPAANQFEIHPRLPQHKLRAACHKLKVQPIAYAPFGGEGAPLLCNETVLAVSQKLGRSPAQVLLQWSMQLGNCVLAKSVRQRHIEDWGMAQESSWQLDDSSMKALGAMEDGWRSCWDPSTVL